MAKIKHFFREEKVYEECCDRGATFKEWIQKRVEHYCCSECGTEVDKKSAFCSECGIKFSGVEESRKTAECYVCKTKFKQLSHEDNHCCPRCTSLLCRNRYNKEDIAKAFYELGRK